MTAPRFFCGDNGHGDVVDLTDANTYSYDTFGTCLSVNIVVDCQPFGFRQGKMQGSEAWRLDLALPSCEEGASSRMCTIQPPPSLIVFMWPWQAPQDWRFIGLLALVGAVGVGTMWVAQGSRWYEHASAEKLRLRREAVTLASVVIYALLLGVLDLLWILPAHVRLSNWYFDQFRVLIALRCDATPLTLTYQQLEATLHLWKWVMIGALSVGLLLVFVARYAARRIASRRQ